MRSGSARRTPTRAPAAARRAPAGPPRPPRTPGARAGAEAPRRSGPGAARRPPAFCAPRTCMIMSLRALRVRAVRNLFEPAPHPYKCLAFHWIRASYAGLALNPHQLLLSNCDFTHLHDSVPTFWREVLRAWGCEGDGLHPATAPDKSTEHAYCPQVTYQEARPLPPFDDGLWHRSPSLAFPPAASIV